MITYWILGAGKFGRRAAQKLQTTRTDAHIVLVDRNRYALKPYEKGAVETQAADAIDYLNRHLRRHDKPDWIVPAVPVHVAFEWVKSLYKENTGIKKLPVPQELFNELPCTPIGERGKLYISLADFVCPDDCCEPAEFCTMTGKPRPYDLFEKLARIQVGNFVSIVVRSRQLAPGVGGYRPGDLFGALDQVRTAESAILLSTACRCHGVLDAFSLTRSPKNKSKYP